MLPLRKNVCLLIFNSQYKLFLGERKGKPGAFQFPQGGVESGTEEENAIREGWEELGVEPDLLRVVKRLNAVNEYEFAETPSYAQGKWRGQSQSFWLLEFLGSDADIDLSRYTPEFRSYCWCTPDEVCQRAEPLRLPGYLEPLREFKRYVQDRGQHP